MNEACKRTIEIEVPAAEVDRETARVTADIAAKVKLPGFRPGKVPLTVIRQKFQQEIRQDVLEAVLPKAFRAKADAEGHQVVGTPNIVDIHYHDGGDLHFKAEFEVAPDVSVGPYTEIEVPYAEPVIEDSEIEHQLQHLREDKADYVNLDPRPLESGDFAVVSLKSLGGIDPVLEQDDVQIELGVETTVSGFTENLTGMSPGEEKEFEVVYPEDYASEKLAGKTIQFHVKVSGVRKKELPEINDDFAKDLGDFQSVAELRERIRQNILQGKVYEAQRDAKQLIVDKLIDAHDFEVPEAYVDRQIEMNVDRQLRQLAGQGIDPNQLKLDWSKIKESQKDRAVKEVRGALLLDKIGEMENVSVSQDEVDHQLQLLARQERMAVPALKARLEKDGSIGRLVSQMRTDKTLQFLFDQAKKTVPVASESESTT